MAEKQTPKASYRFFQNKDCQYFPCHEGADPDTFSCLFCYCPLYLLKDECGGNFTYLPDTGIKDCSNCRIPHTPGGYDHIMSKAGDLIEKAKL